MAQHPSPGPGPWPVHPEPEPWLQTIEDRLKSLRRDSGGAPYYTSPSQVKQDIMTMFENCLQYNPEGGQAQWLRDHAAKARRVFLAAWSKLKLGVLAVQEQVRMQGGRL